MRFSILSLFPEYFQSPFDTTILKKAKEKGAIEIELVNVRDYAEGKHRKVDDKPYGGGPGMLMMVGPLVRAIRAVKRENSLIIYLSPQGKKFDAVQALELSRKNHLILVCGHYEGIDERVMELEPGISLSIGDYVLTNGCIAALAIVDAISRFVPNVLGNEESAKQDSFGQFRFEGPQYTRPPEFESKKVPAVLMKGDHAAIKAWRDLQRSEI